MLTSRVRAVRGVTRAMSFVAAVLIAVFGLTMIGGSAYAGPNDKDKAEKYDFYTLSSNVTAYFSDATKPGEGDGLSAGEGWTTIAQNASEGGNLLGYGDDDVSSFSGWLVSKATGSSNTVGYDSLKVRDNDSSSANSAYSGVLAYAQYGSLLNALGLDSTSTGLGLHFQNMAFGSIMALLYLLAGGIDTIFSAVIWLLETLNPFKFFFSAISASSAAMANGMTGGQGVPVWMQSLDTWFSGWYQALVNLSWTVFVHVHHLVSHVEERQCAEWLEEAGHPYAVPRCRCTPHWFDVHGIVGRYEGCDGGCRYGCDSCRSVDFRGFRELGQGESSGGSE